MINVLGYIRVSTVNQVKEGYSLGEQLDEIEKFCSANGYNLIGYI
ncbi:MAG: recombinase family protein [Oscillibacter sp.]|nr:recombinase family protein [Oscillibacter sp.]